MEQNAGTLKRISRMLGAVGRVVMGKQPAGRNLTVFADDFFIVSYPRSGNTWSRFLLGNLLYPQDPVTFANIEERIPEIYFNPDWKMRKLGRPRVLKSHECFQPHYPRVIYIVRDPRDVAVSFYHHNLKAGNIPDGYPMEDFIPRFIAAEFDTRWGSWADNVMSWLSMRQGRPEFLLLRYEDMKKNPSHELARVATFLEAFHFRTLQASAADFERAVELSSPDRMRALEKEQAANWALTKHTRQDKPFVRTATSGGWKKTLSPASVALMENAWGSLMQSLGYSLQSEQTVESSASMADTGTVSK